jgi:hypothetical protein
MTATSPPVTQAASSLGPVVAIVLATAALLGALLIAGQAGMLPRSPTYAGMNPADQYLSSQTVGERLADR